MELRSVRKRFGSVSALAGASLVAFPGEIHAVLGENGAGKTTLMTVLAGGLGVDAGEVLVDGVRRQAGSLRKSARRGIGMVRQHFALVPALTVAENVALGMRAGSGFRLRLDRVRERLEEIERVTGLPVDAEAPVGRLSVGMKQRVEIVKVLCSDPGILILDEPTAVLTPHEVAWLFGILRSLAEEGRTVLLTGHKLDEILGVADRVTVLRRGGTVLARERGEVGAARLARAMIGHRAQTDKPSRAPAGRRGPVVARLARVNARASAGRSALTDVSLEVRRGEVVGIGGVEGNGQRELALVLSGRVRPESGRAELPATVGLIPQDRAAGGLIPGFDLAENTALGFHDHPGWRRGPLVHWRAVRKTAEEIMAEFGVRAPGWRAPARTLSGGNQQKFLAGRELARAPDLLVAENPMRGLDIAAAAFLRDKLEKLRAAGAGAPGIVLFSTDLEEVLELADRVFVLARGRLIPVAGEDRSPAGMGRLMLAPEGADAPPAHGFGAAV